MGLRVLGSVLLLAAAATAAPLELQRLTRVEELPAPERCVVVEVDADGRRLVGGRELPLPAIGNHLIRAGDRDLVIRADRHAPWGAVRSVARLAAVPPRRAERVRFVAVAERGNREGALVVRLKDAPVGDAGPALALPVRLRSAGPPADPTALDRSARSFLVEPRMAAVVSVDVRLPTGYVLRVLDVLRRAGARSVRLVDPPRVAPPGALQPGLDVFGVPPPGLVVPVGPADAAPVETAILLGLPHVKARSVLEMIDRIPTYGSAGGAFGGRISRPWIEKEGGGEDTEKAVSRGLAWIVRRQNLAGSWGEDGDEVGSTGLALLALLGAGHAPHMRIHRTPVLRGLAYLLQVQDETGRFASDEDEAHLLATWAVTEGYALTGDAALKASAQRGVDVVVAGAPRLRGAGPRSGPSSRSRRRRRRAGSGSRASSGPGSGETSPTWRTRPSG
jgi:biopolymer transport protein ExbD